MYCIVCFPLWPSYHSYHQPNFYFCVCGRQNRSFGGHRRNFFGGEFVMFRTGRVLWLIRRKVVKWSYRKRNNSACSDWKLNNYMKFENYRMRSFEWHHPEICTFSRLEMRAHRSWYCYENYGGGDEVFITLMIGAPQKSTKISKWTGLNFLNGVDVW